MPEPNPDKLAGIIAAWQPLSPAPLTEQDAEEIRANLTALGNLLLEIDRDADSREPGAQRRG